MEDFTDEAFSRERAMQRVRNRRKAYARTFLADDAELHRHAALVLADLKRFCRAAESTLMVSPVTGQVDPLATAAAEGRREVWMRIIAHLHLEDRITLNLEEPTNE